MEDEGGVVSIGGMTKGAETNDVDDQAFRCSLETKRNAFTVLGTESGGSG